MCFPILKDRHDRHQKVPQADRGQPGYRHGKTLACLVRGLESDEKFELGDLYKLDYESFALDIDVLKEWRLDRYYLSKAKLLDISVQMASFPE